MRFCVLLALAVASVSTLGCGGTTSNCAPAGTYTASFARAADPGDCSGNVPAIPSSEFTVKANDTCGQYQSQITGTTSDGCSYTGTMKATAGASGFSNASMSMTMDCTSQGGSSCTANWTATVTKK